MEAYTPKNGSAVLFLEDDLQASPYFFHYLLWCLRYHEKRGKYDDMLLGYSFYTLTRDEYARIKPWVPAELYRDYHLLRLQTPCSWGALYLSGHWKRFQRYYQLRTPTDRQKVLRLQSDGWKKSWVKYLMEYMALRGAYMIYPNLNSIPSFSNL